MEKPKKQEDKKVDIPTGQIVLPKIDIKLYIGKKAKIASADIFEGNYGMYVKISTEIVDTIGKGDQKIELCGTKILGLHKDEKENWGWSADTKLGQYLKKMNCKTLNDLIGKVVILQSQTSKTNTDFLTFN
jgi:hypothetical protein